jgi:hypothetical protein
LLNQHAQGENTEKRCGKEYRYDNNNLVGIVFEKSTLQNCISATAICVVSYEAPDATDTKDSNRHDADKQCVKVKKDELFLVADPDACADPGTMVVHPQDAAIAPLAMVSSGRLGAIAHCAVFKHV